VTESLDILLVGLGRWGEKHLRVLREIDADMIALQEVINHEGRSPQENQACFNAFAIFKDICRSVEVVFDHLPRAAAIVYSGEDTGISSGINYPINRRKVLEVRGVSNIAVLDGDSS